MPLPDVWTPAVNDEYNQLIAYEKARYDHDDICGEAACLNYIGHTDEAGLIVDIEGALSMTQPNFATFADVWAARASVGNYCMIQAVIQNAEAKTKCTVIRNRYYAAYKDWAT